MVRPKLTLIENVPPEQTPDAMLAEALIRGEPQAPITAWRRLQPVVDGMLRRLMGPGAEIEDLRQEVFLRFFRQVTKLRDPNALRSFLYGICLRVVRRDLRGRWLRRFLRLTDSGEPPEIPVAAPDREAREVLRRYYAVLERLGATARSLFVARHIEQLSLAEVATLHGMSVSTVQRHLSRVSRRVAAAVAGDPVLAAYVAATKEGRSS